MRINNKSLIYRSETPASEDVTCYRKQTNRHRFRETIRTKHNLHETQNVTQNKTKEETKTIRNGQYSYHYDRGDVGRYECVDAAARSRQSDT